MKSYEFRTSLNDGIIHIPTEFREKIFNNTKNVKVILIPEADEKANTKKLSFPYFAVDTTGYVFDREEANER